MLYFRTLYNWFIQQFLLTFMHFCFFLPHYMEELSLSMAGGLEPDVLQSPFQLNQKKLDFESPYLVTLFEVTQACRQQGRKSWLKDRADFGPKGEAFKSSREHEVSHEFLMLNFSPPYPWARNGGQGATVPGVWLRDPGLQCGKCLHDE